MRSLHYDSIYKENEAKPTHPSFIHSFSHFYSAPLSPLLLKAAPDYSTDTASEFHAEAHRLAQGPYMAAGAGVEPTTLWLKVIASTKAPPRPTNVLVDKLGELPT